VCERSWAWAGRLAGIRLNNEVNKAVIHLTQATEAASTRKARLPSEMNSEAEPQDRMEFILAAKPFTVRWPSSSSLVYCSTSSSTPIIG
jgi:hypothetical protein